MSTFSLKRYRVIILLCLLTVMLSVIFGVVVPVVRPPRGSPPAAQSTVRPASPSKPYHYKDRRALEAYEKRNAEIDSWIEDDAIPDHNNAALLYYQALLLRPDHNQKIINKFHDVLHGEAEPDTRIRILLGQWLPSMKISEIASRMPQCTWGVWPEMVWPSEKRSRIFLMITFRHFSYIIAVDAIMLASEGHYRAALERCMTIRRIARHLSHDPLLHLVSGACEGTALRTILGILGDIPLDEDILTWFQSRLATFQEATPFLERFLQKCLRNGRDLIQTSSIARLRGMLLKRAADERARQHIRDLTDDQIRNQALDAVQGFYDSIFAILLSDKSAEQKQVEIQELTHYTINRKVFEPLMKIYHEFGGEISDLIVGRGIDMTEEKKLSEIQKIIDKSSEPNTVELLTKFSHAVGKDIDFGFFVNREMTDEQKRAEMQKAIDKLSEAYAIETSTFGLSLNSIDGDFTSQVGHTAWINSLKAAVELYLIIAKTGQLPEELPDDLPKDPYTGKDFLYERTDDGFVLACQSQSDFFRRGKERLTFQVPKKNN